MIKITKELPMTTIQEKVNQRMKKILISLIKKMEYKIIFIIQIYLILIIFVASLKP